MRPAQRNSGQLSYTRYHYTSDTTDSLDQLNSSCTKKVGSLRICLDPKDLNRAIQREYYQLPTIEDIVKRLHSAKVFTILDVGCGF